MAKQQSDSIKKPIEQLTDTEVETLMSQLEARRQALRQAQEKEELWALAATDRMAEVLEWNKLRKLPKLILTPDGSGKKYEVVPPVIGKNSSSKRTQRDVNSGKVTIKKLGDLRGGIVQFKDRDGTEYKTIKELIKALKQPNKEGKPTNMSEWDRCWDCVHKGISASEILTRHHPDITLLFGDGSQMTVGDAVKAMKANKTTS